MHLISILLISHSLQVEDVDRGGVRARPKREDRKWGAGVGSVGQSFRQEALSHIPERVEISGAWVAGSINRVSVPSIFSQ